MITFSKLGKMGRLGNSLFQLCTTIVHAKDINQRATFPAEWPYWKDFPQLKEITNVFSEQFPYIQSTMNFYVEPHFEYAPIPHLKRDYGSYKDQDLSGYFQSAKYFDLYKSYIQYQWLDFNYDIKKKTHEKYSSIIEKGFTAIHIRRGDYVNIQQYHTLLPIQYYLDGIERVYNIRHINYPIVCFSDDIEWCKQHITATVFIEGNRDVEDLYLTTLADNIVIANSSFSWWGSYLNRNKNVVTVAPKNWFGPAYACHNTKDLYCLNWVII